MNLQGLCRLAVSAIKNIFQTASPQRALLHTKTVGAHLSGYSREKDMKGTNMQISLDCCLFWRGASGPCSQEKSEGEESAAGSSACLEEAPRGSGIS